MKTHNERDKAMFTSTDGYVRKETLKTINNDVHLRILWPKQVPAFQKTVVEALDNDSMTLEDIKSLVSGLMVLSPSPAVKGRTMTDGIIQFESYKGRLALMYAGLKFDAPSLISDVDQYAIVSEQGSEWHVICEVKGITYAVPTSTMDCIVPMEVVEEFGISSLTARFNPGCYVLKKKDRVAVEKSHRSVSMSRLDKVDTEVKIPLSIGEPRGVSAVTGEKFSVGYAREDGIIDFPYDMMTCMIPCKKGEVYLFGQDLNGEWYPVDVVSDQRNLRMSILKGIYGVCKGRYTLIYSTLGGLVLSNLGVVELLHNIKLNHSGKVVYKDGYTDGAVAWIEGTFDGCAFDFEEIFGYTTMTKKEPREDIGNARLTQTQLFYDVTVEEFVRQNVTISGDWRVDIKEMLGVDVSTYEDLMSILVKKTKQYAFIKGKLYFERKEVFLTPEICHELWFEFLGTPVRYIKSCIFLNTPGRSSVFTVLNVGGYIYANKDHKYIQVHRLTSVVPEINQEHIETVIKEASMLKGDEWPPERRFNMSEVPAILGPGDWKSKVNEEIQRRGDPLIRYEHDVKNIAGVPRFRCFVNFKGRRIQGDDFMNSKKATEFQVAGKLYELLKKEKG